jgi:hypothetical protein
MMFANNTSFHWSIQMSLLELKLGLKSRTIVDKSPDLGIKYGKDLGT